MDQNQQQETFQSRAAICEELNISITTLKKIIDNAQVPLSTQEMPGGGIRYLSSEISNLMNPNTTLPTEPQPTSAAAGTVEFTDDNNRDHDGAGRFVPTNTATGVEFQIVNESGKVVDIWDTEPDEQDIEDGYGFGSYRVFEIDRRTGKKLGVTRFIIREQQQQNKGDDILDMMLKYKKLMAPDHPAPSGGNDKMLELLLSQNQLFLQLLLKGKDSGGISQVKDILDFARDYGMLGDGGDNENEMVDKIIDAAGTIIPNAIEALTAGRKQQPQGPALDMTGQFPTLPAVTVEQPTAAGDPGDGDGPKTAVIQ